MSPNDLLLGRYFFFYLLMPCRLALLRVCSRLPINNTFISYDTHIIISDFSANKLKSKLQLTIDELMLWVSIHKLTIKIAITACP